MSNQIDAAINTLVELLANPTNYIKSYIISEFNNLDQINDLGVIINKIQKLNRLSEIISSDPATKTAMIVSQVMSSVAIPKFNRPISSFHIAKDYIRNGKWKPIGKIEDFETDGDDGIKLPGPSENYLIAINDNNETIIHEFVDDPICVDFSRLKDCCKETDHAIINKAAAFTSYIVTDLKQKLENTNISLTGEIANSIAKVILIHLRILY